MRRWRVARSGDWWVSLNPVVDLVTIGFAALMASIVFYNVWPGTEGPATLIGVAIVVALITIAQLTARRRIAA